MNSHWIHFQIIFLLKSILTNSFPPKRQLNPARQERVYEFTSDPLSNHISMHAKIHTYKWIPPKTSIKHSSAELIVCPCMLKAMLTNSFSPPSIRPSATRKSTCIQMSKPILTKSFPPRRQLNLARQGWSSTHISMHLWTHTYKSISYFHACYNSYFQSKRINFARPYPARKLDGF